MWSWNVESSAYGDPKPRSREIVISSRLPIARSDNMAPIYIFDVSFHSVIREFLRKSRDSLEGVLALCPETSGDVHQPTPVGRVALPSARLCYGTKTDQGIVIGDCRGGISIHA